MPLGLNTHTLLRSFKVSNSCPLFPTANMLLIINVDFFKDFDEFLITDKDAERKYKFQLKESLARAKTSRLLEGYTVLVTPSVKPGPKDMKGISFNMAYLFQITIRVTY